MDDYNMIYQEIENEILKLPYVITLVEEHKNVYSPKIAELIIRAAGLLESALKFKYFENKRYDKHIKYDSNKLIDNLNIRDNLVHIIFKDYKLTKKTFSPFIMKEERVNASFSNIGKLGNGNYSWNNSYQSLRHQFIKSIHYYGNLYYLFETMAALYSILDVKSLLFCKPEMNDDGSYSAMVYLGGGAAIRKKVEVRK